MKNNKRSLGNGFIFRSVSAFGLGVGAMYYMDPERGARRRHRVGEWLTHNAHRTSQLINKGTRDAKNRGYGILAHARAVTTPSEVTDEVLVARVRSKLGRYVSHPHSIDVSARDGRVVLRGLILESELERLVSRLERVRGVKEVINELEAHREEDGIPGLQGGEFKRGEKLDLLQSNWAPATRLLMGSLGGWSVYQGMRTRGLRGSLASMVGGTVFLRSLSNLDVRTLLGLLRGKNSFSLHKTINVSAPVERVFDFCSHFENFHKLMDEVQSIRVYDGGNAHWVMRGIGGVTIRWDSMITRQEPNELLSWRSLPGSMIQNAGRIRFQPEPGGGTRVDLDFTYRPPLGALGHFLAMLSGSDPKSKLDRALARMKNLLEQQEQSGRPRAAAA